VQSLSTHFAKEGFKKGYDYGKREERVKVFNIQERIQAFRDEMQPICKKYGIGFLNSYVDMEISAGTIKFKEQFAGSFHDMVEAYVKEMVAEF
jgi:flagellar biosynthesis/type III secretory pathway protein FliH